MNRFCLVYDKKDDQKGYRQQINQKQFSAVHSHVFKYIKNRPGQHEIPLV